MKKGYFITATDTGVGKTFIACLLARYFKDRGLKVGVMKPIETGCGEKNEKLIPKDALALKNASGCSSPIDVINPYRFAPPLAPSIAARISGIKVDLKKIKKSSVEISKNSDIMLVEGAGGLLTPTSDKKTIVDMIIALKLPCLVVSTSKLGCINSILLTYQEAMRLGVKVNGVILNHPTVDTDESSKYNAEELKRFGIPVLGEVPFLKDGKGIEDFLDIELLVKNPPLP